MARPRTFDETAVVDAARDRFWQTGYAGTGLEDLVEATGIARGSLYNAFGDKHSLYIRGFDSYCTMVIERVRSRLDGPDETAAEHLRELLRRGAAANAGTADAPPLACFLAKASAELAVRDPQI